jgi:hypothetical protein
MVRQRNVGGLKPDRPPFRPLTVEEAAKIGSAGGIKVDCQDDSGQKFVKVLDSIRIAYERETERKLLSLTDQQIADRLKEARDLATRLRKVLDDRALFLQTFVLTGPEHNKPCLMSYDQFPTNVLEPFDRIVYWANCCLENLAERTAKSPDALSVPTAKKTGLNELTVDLMWLWCVTTGAIRPPTEGRLPLLQFVQEGTRIITQIEVGIDAVRKRVCRFAPSAGPRFRFEENAWSGASTKSLI